ncbi:3269_t:CDS:2, partial [Gigaspora margarita]
KVGVLNKLTRLKTRNECLEEKLEYYKEQQEKDQKRYEEIQKCYEKQQKESQKRYDLLLTKYNYLNEYREIFVVLNRQKNFQKKTVHRFKGQKM